MRRIYTYYYGSSPDVLYKAFKDKTKLYIKGSWVKDFWGTVTKIDFGYISFDSIPEEISFRSIKEIYVEDNETTQSK